MTVVKFEGVTVAANEVYPHGYPFCPHCDQRMVEFAMFTSTGANLVDANAPGFTVYRLGDHVWACRNYRCRHR